MRVAYAVEETILDDCYEKKRMKWALKYKNWTVNDWRKFLFSDESLFLLQGQRSQHVRRSVGEPIQECHINQSVKHPQKDVMG